MISRRFFTFGLTIALSGCVTVPPHRFSVQEVQSWKVVSIDGALADTARPLWPKVLDEFTEKNLPRSPSQTVVDAQGGPDRVIVGERPPITDDVRRAARAYVQAQFAERVRFYMDPLRGALNGQRPVRVVTTLHGLDVPSLGRQIGVGVALALFVGPGAQPPGSSMTLSTDILDAKTGSVLASYPKRTILRSGGDALVSIDSSDQYGGDAVAGMLRSYQADFNTWLLQK